MYRRLLVVVALVFLAGCVSTGGNDATTPESVVLRTEASSGYTVSASVVEVPPENATVTAYDSSRLENASVTTAVLQKTYEARGIWMDIPKEQFDSLESELSDVPLYEGGEYGYYVEYRGVVVRIQTIVDD